MIKRIQIENFKSFGKVDLEPHPRVNLLIGPNSSGKSNFLEAISFGQNDPIQIETLGHSLTTLSKNLNRSKNSPSYTINLIFNNLSGTAGLFDHLKLNYSPFSIHLNLSFKDFVSANYLFSKANGLQLDIRGEISEEEISKYLLSLQSSKIVKYVPSLEKMRAGIVIRPDFNKISNDLSDIALLINHLNQNFRTTHHQNFMNDLKKITNEFDLITTPPGKQPGEIEMRFFSGEIGYSSNGVSDGILLFSAFLAILHQPNPPKVILLEEPENGIHPRRLSEIISLIWKLAEEKDVQFFITTHSPVILDQFSESPECVWVFDKKEGITEIQNLEKIIEAKHAFAKANGLPELDYTAELSENWLWGLLDGVPPTTQI